MATKVKMLFAARDISIADVASRLNPPISRQTLAAKLKKDNLREQDAIEIAAICNASFEGVFTLNDTKETI